MMKKIGTGGNDNQIKNKNVYLQEPLLKFLQVYQEKMYMIRKEVKCMLL